MFNIYYMTVDDVSPDRQASMEEALSKSELAYCKRMKKPHDYLLSLCGHYMMRCVAGDGVLYRKSGKPYYDGGPFVSLSHDQNTVTLSVCDAPCGVDVLFADAGRKTKIAKVVGRFVHDVKQGTSPAPFAVSLFRFSLEGGDVKTTPCAFSPLSDTDAAYGDAIAFTKAEALMKCDGRGFGAITLLHKLKQTMTTVSFTIPDLKDSVITAARLA